MKGANTHGKLTENKLNLKQKHKTYLESKVIKMIKLQ